ncbi:MAG: hypothetical protein M1826_005626 [Phylliscum demangeonii]|nr:MAG: hypothetical protein M1826_005626 [Phylliscum demangeonii]
MILCLGMPAHAAAAHRHEFSPTSIRPTTAWSRGPLKAVPAAVGLPSPPSSEFHSTSSIDVAAHPSMSVADRPAAAVDEAETPPPSVDESPGPMPLSAASSVKLGPRTRTAYHLAHPPPSFLHRQRLHLRPRLLLQLQRIYASGRPMPTLDVLPSTLLAPALVRSLPQLFRSKDRLCAEDLVVVRSEDYRSSRPAAGERAADETAHLSEVRHVIATIGRRPKEESRGAGPSQAVATAAAEVEICLRPSARWDARRLPNGGYELTARTGPDACTIARWVPRPARTRRRSATAPHVESRKFTFSLINPDARRHPIIATLTPSTIHVLDEYPVSVSSSTSPSPVSTPSTPVAPSSPPTAVDDAPAPPRTMPMEDELRMLILVTGLWIAVREGWSQCLREDDRPPPLLRSTSDAAVHAASSARRAAHPAPREANPGGAGPRPSTARRSAVVSFVRTLSDLSQYSERSVLAGPASSAESTPPRRAHSTSSPPSWPSRHHPSLPPPSGQLADDAPAAAATAATTTTTRHASDPARPNPSLGAAPPPPPPTESPAPRSIRFSRDSSALLPTAPKSVPRVPEAPTSSSHAPRKKHRRFAGLFCFR